MRKVVVALLALAAVAPLTAGTLADFSEGMGRVVTTSRYYTEQPVVSIVEDATAPNGKVLLAKLSGRKEGTKFARYDVVVKYSAEEAEKIREIAFDAKISSRKAFGGGVLYFFKAGRTPDYLGHTLPMAKFREGVWTHVSFPVSSFKAAGKGLEMSETRQLVITFFTFSPLEVSVANITFAE